MSYYNSNSYGGGAGGGGAAAAAAAAAGGDWSRAHNSSSYPSGSSANQSHHGTHHAQQSNTNSENNSWSHQYQQQPSSHHANASQAYSNAAWQDGRSKNAMHQASDHHAPSSAEVNHLIRNLQLPGSAAFSNSAASSGRSSSNAPQQQQQQQHGYQQQQQPHQMYGQSSLSAGLYTNSAGQAQWSQNVSNANANTSSRGQSRNDASQQQPFISPHDVHRQTNSSGSASHMMSLGGPMLGSHPHVASPTYAAESIGAPSPVADVAPTKAKRAPKPRKPAPVRLPEVVATPVQHPAPLTAAAPAKGVPKRKRKAAAEVEPAPAPVPSAPKPAPAAAAKQSGRKKARISKGAAAAAPAPSPPEPEPKAAASSKRGRPKGSKDKPKASSGPEKEITMYDGLGTPPPPENPMPPKRKRGRPSKKDTNAGGEVAAPKGRKTVIADAAVPLSPAPPPLVATASVGPPSGKYGEDWKELFLERLHNTRMFGSMIEDEEMQEEFDGLIRNLEEMASGSMPR
ncbi:hypothetical protein CBOM_03916 [Ceraceosorus bombacis]|uniref:Uncharacterized protein n=1 Tax=Ceraceosorus bombacis TaxID=401625 RepID=A0A0P1BNL5_9BASI|nr:hypothetical protein CBOM_03916 [Ceraceosorus bombacis]